MPGSDALEALDADLWVATRPLPLWVGDVGTRMTVLRLGGGNLLLHSPVSLDPALRASFHGDQPTIDQVLLTLAFQVRDGGIKLDAAEQRQMVAFLKSLTDPAARDLSTVIPTAVPSALPVR